METRPGIKTTEFWVSIFAAAMSILTTSGVFTPEQASTTVGAAIQLGGLVGVVGSAFGYSLSRGRAKTGIKPD